MSEKKTKAASGLVICNYNGHKVTNAYLSTSNMSSPRDTEDREVPVSGIRKWTYILVNEIAYTKGSPLIATSQIDIFGFGNVAAAMEVPLNERDVLLFACEGEVLVSMSNSITQLGNSLVAEKSCSGQRSCHDLEERCLCHTEPLAAYPPIRFAPPRIFIPQRRAVYARRGARRRDP